jgi:hypothetical protein
MNIHGCKTEVMVDQRDQYKAYSLLGCPYNWNVRRGTAYSRIVGVPTAVGYYYVLRDLHNALTAGVSNTNVT